jgi:hypothetical protein
LTFRVQRSINVHTYIDNYRSFVNRYLLKSIGEHKDLVERCLGTAELSTGTYPELLEHCIRICERSRGQVVPFSIPVLNDELYFLYKLFNYLYAFEGGLINDDGEIIFKSQETIDAFTWLKSLTNRAHINMSNSYIKNGRLFANDGLAFIVEGPWLSSRRRASRTVKKRECSP